MADEATPLKLIERVKVEKFDHTHEDHPTTPCEVIIQETVTEISRDEAIVLGLTVPNEEPRDGD